MCERSSDDLEIYSTDTPSVTSGDEHVDLNDIEPSEGLLHGLPMDGHLVETLLGDTEAHSSASVHKQESGLNALKQAMEVCQQDLKNADQIDGSDTVDQVDGSDAADQIDGNDTADQTDGNDTADETDFQVVDQCSGSTRRSSEDGDVGMHDAVESVDFEVVDECDGKSVESETKDHSNSEPKTTPDEESREESSSSPLCIEVHLSADDNSVIEDEQQQTDESDTSPVKAGALELEIEVDDIEMADGEEEQPSQADPPAAQSADVSVDDGTSQQMVTSESEDVGGHYNSTSAYADESTQRGKGKSQKKRERKKQTEKKEAKRRKTVSESNAVSDDDDELVAKKRELAKSAVKARKSHKRAGSKKHLRQKVYIINETHLPEEATAEFEAEEKRLSVKLHRIENLNGGKKIVARGYVSARKYLKAVSKQKWKIPVPPPVVKSPIKKGKKVETPAKMQKDKKIEKSVKKETTPKQKEKVVTKEPKTVKNEVKDKKEIVKTEVKEKPVKTVPKKQGVIKKISAVDLMSADKVSKPPSEESIDFSDSDAEDNTVGMESTIGDILANLNTPTKQSASETPVIAVAPISLDFKTAPAVEDSKPMDGMDTDLKSEKSDVLKITDITSMVSKQENKVPVTKPVDKVIDKQFKVKSQALIDDSDSDDVTVEPAASCSALDLVRPSSVQIESTSQPRIKGLHLCDRKVAVTLRRLDDLSVGEKIVRRGYFSCERFCRICKRENFEAHIKFDTLMPSVSGTREEKVVDKAFERAKERHEKIKRERQEREQKMRIEEDEVRSLEKKEQKVKEKQEKRAAQEKLAKEEEKRREEKEKRRREDKERRRKREREADMQRKEHEDKLQREEKGNIQGRINMDDSQSSTAAQPSEASTESNISENNKEERASQDVSRSASPEPVTATDNHSTAPASNKSTVERTSNQKQEGNYWTCANKKCRRMNNADQVTCISCKLARPMSQIMPKIPKRGLMTPSSAVPKVVSVSSLYTPTKTPASKSVNAKIMDRINSSQPKQGTENIFDSVMRDVEKMNPKVNQNNNEDWRCANRFRGMVCGFMNRSWKKNCVKCRSPKPSHDQNAANDASELRPLPNGMWRCLIPNCKMVSKAFKTSCPQCGTIKGGNEVPTPPPEKAFWVCDRTTCNHCWNRPWQSCCWKCKAPKPANNSNKNTLIRGNLLVRLSPVHLMANQQDVQNFLAGVEIIGCHFMNTSVGAAARDIYVEVLSASDLQKAITFDKHFMNIQQGAQSIVNVESALRSHVLHQLSTIGSAPVGATQIPPVLAAADSTAETQNNLDPKTTDPLMPKPNVLRMNMDGTLTPMNTSTQKPETKPEPIDGGVNAGRAGKISRWDVVSGSPDYHIGYSRESEYKSMDDTMSQGAKEKPDYRIRDPKPTFKSMNTDDFNYPKEGNQYAPMEDGFQPDSSTAEGAKNPFANIDSDLLQKVAGILQDASGQKAELGKNEHERLKAGPTVSGFNQMPDFERAAVTAALLSEVSESADSEQQPTNLQQNYGDTEMRRIEHETPTKPEKSVSFTDGMTRSADDSREASAGAGDGDSPLPDSPGAPEADVSSEEEDSAYSPTDQTQEIPHAAALFAQRKQKVVQQIEEERRMSKAKKKELKFKEERRLAEEKRRADKKKIEQKKREAKNMEELKRKKRILEQKLREEIRREERQKEEQRREEKKREERRRLRKLEEQKRQAAASNDGPKSIPLNRDSQEKNHDQLAKTLQASIHCVEMSNIEQSTITEDLLKARNILSQLISDKVKVVDDLVRSGSPALSVENVNHSEPQADNATPVSGSQAGIAQDSIPQDPGQAEDSQHAVSSTSTDATQLQSTEFKDVAGLNSFIAPNMSFIGTKGFPIPGLEGDDAKNSSGLDTDGQSELPGNEEVSERKKSDAEIEDSAVPVADKVPAAGIDENLDPQDMELDGASDLEDGEVREKKVIDRCAIPPQIEDGASSSFPLNSTNESSQSRAGAGALPELADMNVDEISLAMDALPEELKTQAHGDVLAALVQLKNAGILGQILDQSGVNAQVGESAAPEPDYVAPEPDYVAPDSSVNMDIDMPASQSEVNTEAWDSVQEPSSSSDQSYVTRENFPPLPPEPPAPPVFNFETMNDGGGWRAPTASDFEIVAPPKAPEPPQRPERPQLNMPYDQHSQRPAAGPRGPPMRTEHDYDDRFTTNYNHGRPPRPRTPEEPLRYPQHPSQERTTHPQERGMYPQDHLMHPQRPMRPQRRFQEERPMLPQSRPLHPDSHQMPSNRFRHPGYIDQQPSNETWKNRQHLQSGGPHEAPQFRGGPRPTGPPPSHPPSSSVHGSEGYDRGYPPHRRPEHPMHNQAGQRDDHSSLTDGLNIKAPQLYSKRKPQPPMNTPMNHPVKPPAPSYIDSSLPPLPPPPSRAKSGPRGLVDYDSDDSADEMPGQMPGPSGGRGGGPSGGPSGGAMNISRDIRAADQVLRNVPPQIARRLRQLPDMLQILTHDSCVDILWKTIKQMQRLEDTAGEALGADELDMIIGVFVKRSRELM